LRLGPWEEWAVRSKTTSRVKERVYALDRNAKKRGDSWEGLVVNLHKKKKQTKPARQKKKPQTTENQFQGSKREKTKNARGFY